MTERLPFDLKETNQNKNKNKKRKRKDKKMDVAYLRAVFATAQERNEIIFTEFGISTFRRFPATLIRVIEVYFPQIFFE